MCEERKGKVSEGRQNGFPVSHPKENETFLLHSHFLTSCSAEELEAPS
jgi:hypothetical protein